MQLADKIITERKKLGLSQEELADKLSVSRQAVSKWEMAQSVPDIQKIIAMSDLFSVSTDYLLKSEQAPADSSEKKHARCVTLDEAEKYISETEKRSKAVSLGTVLCIICPIPFMFFLGFSKQPFGLPVPVAISIGLVMFFAIIAVAVFLFVRSKTRPELSDSPSDQEFVLSYEASSWAEKNRMKAGKKGSAWLSSGIILCILSPIPLIISVILSGYSSAEQRSFIIVCMTAVLLCIIAAGIYLIVRTTGIRAEYDTLFRAKKNEAGRLQDTAAGIFWGIVSCVYLTWSFLSGEWQFTWIIWPVASVLSKVLAIIMHSKKAAD